MKRVIIAAMLVAAGVTAARVPATAGQQPAVPGQAPLDPRVVVWDQGADKIDVSKYPPDVKQKYKVFADVCTRCHTLARAVNCDFALEDDWERYIKRMMRRGKGLITPEIARDAYEFAVFDSKVRKKDLYDRKLKETAQK